jgi:hypothetical protein
VINDISDRVRAKFEAAGHMIQALRDLARQPCDRRNCGTVCLCGPCHARKALEWYEPDWRP